MCYLFRVRKRKDIFMKTNMTDDMTKELMSSPKCRSVEVINNPTKPGLNHREVNCINHK